MVTILEVKCGNHTVFPFLILLVLNIWVFHEIANLCESAQTYIESIQVFIDRHFEEVRVVLAGIG